MWKSVLLRVKPKVLIMPLDDSLEIMRTTDKLRRSWDFLYPEEKLGD